MSARVRKINSSIDQFIAQNPDAQDTARILIELAMQFEIHAANAGDADAYQVSRLLVFRVGYLLGRPSLSSEVFSIQHHLRDEKYKRNARRLVDSWYEDKRLFKVTSKRMLHMGQE